MPDARPGCTFDFSASGDTSLPFHHWGVFLAMKCVSLSETFPSLQGEPRLFTELCKNILACSNQNEKPPWGVADGLLKRNEAD